MLLGGALFRADIRFDNFSKSSIVKFMGDFGKPTGPETMLDSIATRVSWAEVQLFGKLIWK